MLLRDAWHLSPSPAAIGKRAEVPSDDEATRPAGLRDAGRAGGRESSAGGKQSDNGVGAA